MDRKKFDALFSLDISRYFREAIGDDEECDLLDMPINLDVGELITEAKALSQKFIKHVLFGTKVKGVMDSGGHSYNAYLDAEKAGWFNPQKDVYEFPSNGVLRVKMTKHPNPLRRGINHTFFPQGWDENRIRSAIQQIIKDTNIPKIPLPKKVGDYKIGVVDGVKITVGFKVDTGEPFMAYPESYQ